MKLTMPQAVIFDWDDTIVQTWPAIFNAINDTLEAYGHPRWSEAQARQRIGPPARVLFPGIFGEEKWEDADRHYKKAYMAYAEKNMILHDHALDIIEILHAQNLPLFVVSSKRQELLDRDVAHFEMGHFFQSVVGAGTAEKDKPHREVVDYALKGSEIVPSRDIWFVGDSRSDLQCAEASGCQGVLIKPSGLSADLGTEFPSAKILSTHAEVLSLIKDFVQSKS